MRASQTLAQIMQRVDRETSPPEQSNGPMPWSGPQTAVVERALKEKASAEPSTQDGIETLRLCALLFRARLSIDRVPSFFPQP